MITDVVLPQMGLEVAEGVVLALPVEVGQAVAEGDVVAEVETDKAIAEVPASRAGVIVAIEVALEDTIPIGTVIVRIADSADETAEASPTAAAAADPCHRARRRRGRRRRDRRGGRPVAERRRRFQRLPPPNGAAEPPTAPQASRRADRPPRRRGARHRPSTCHRDRPVRTHHSR